MTDSDHSKRLLSPRSSRFQATADLISIMGLLDCYADELTPLEYNSLARAAQRLCADLDTPFAALGIVLRNEERWLTQLEDIFHPKYRDDQMK